MATAAATFIAPIAIRAIADLLNHARQNNSRRNEENNILREELRGLYERQNELVLGFAQIVLQTQQKHIQSYEELAERDKEAAKSLIRLARKTEPIKTQGTNIGILGLTSTGKSCTVNGLSGKKIAETGAGETTIKITPYPSDKFVLWDLPGKNDAMAYLSMEYIGFFKGLTRRLILITSTVKENSNLMKLLDAINLQYDIVVNKFDLIDEDERQKVKDQIQREIKTLQLKKVNKVFYLSAKYPQMFPDWLEMVNYLTN